MLSIGYVRHAAHDSFARGTETDFWTLEFFSVGEVLLTTIHGEKIYQAPCMALIPPHTAYTERAVGKGLWTEHYAIFEPLPHWHHWLLWPQSECNLGLLDLSNSLVASEVKNAFEAALTYQRSARANQRLLVLNALEKVLLMLDEINPARGHAQRDARIESVLEYIAVHYREPLDLESLARRAFLSPSRFSHLFKTQIKMAPLQYLESYRLERAAEKLLRSSQSIEQISSAVGFNNAFHFSTRFRRRFGQSPSGYRRNPSA